jgi:hypothetical protein
MPSGWIASRLRRRRSGAPAAPPRRDERSVPEPPVAEHEPEPAPAPDVMPGPRPEPSPEDDSPDEPEPPEPAPSTPRIAAVAPSPEPEPQPRREPQREGSSEPHVVSIGARGQRPPREWNLWELERIARAQAGPDAARDEERAFLLMYLRQFATTDGLLPVDFDGVVREAFDDVLDVPYS